MSVALDFTLEARRDLLEIEDTLTAHSERTAARFRNAVEKTFSRIASLPRLGAVASLETLAAAGIRCLSIDRFPNYIAFYRPTETGVLVLRVIHAARDLEAAFGDPEAD